MPPRSQQTFSGKTQRQLDLARGKGVPPSVNNPVTEIERTPPPAAHNVTHERQRRIEQIGPEYPSEPMVVQVGEEEVDLADPTRFPNASDFNNRAAWLEVMRSKVPAPEDHIEQIRFNGDDFSLHGEDGERVPWGDGRDKDLGPFR